MNNKWLIANSIAVLFSILFAGVALIFSWQSNNTANKANDVALQSNDIALQSNDIAERAYQAAYQANLPIITAIITFDYDAYAGGYRDTITVRNGGGPLQEFSPSVETVASIIGAGKTTYILLDGFLDYLRWNGNNTGLLATTTSWSDNSKFYSLQGAFWEAASKDGYQAFISRETLLLVSYKDYLGTYWNRYFSVNYNGSWEIEESSARATLELAAENIGLAYSKGLSLHIDLLDGSTLWTWYKREFVE